MTDWAEISIKLQQLHEDRQDALNAKNYLLAGVIHVQITEWNDKMSLWIREKIGVKYYEVRLQPPVHVMYKPLSGRN